MLFLYCGFFLDDEPFLGYFCPILSTSRILFKQRSILVKNEKKIFFRKFDQIYNKRNETEFWWGIFLFLYFGFFLKDNRFLANFAEKIFFEKNFVHFCKRDFSQNRFKTENLGQRRCLFIFQRIFSWICVESALKNNNVIRWQLIIQEYKIF